MMVTKSDDPDKRSPWAWIRAALVGIGICGLVGPMLPLLVLMPIGVFNERSLGHGALSALEMLPIAWLGAIVAVGPAGALLGTLGALWIRFRSRTLTFKWLSFETVLAGLALGAVAPFQMYAFWGNRDDLSSFKGYILMGCASGVVCAVLVLLALNRLRLLSTKENPD